MNHRRGYWARPSCNAAVSCSTHFAHDIVLVSISANMQTMGMDIRRLANAVLESQEILFISCDANQWT